MKDRTRLTLAFVLAMAGAASGSLMVGTIVGPDIGELVEAMRADTVFVASRIDTIQVAPDLSDLRLALGNHEAALERAMEARRSDTEAHFGRIEHDLDAIRKSPPASTTMVYIVKDGEAEPVTPDPDGWLRIPGTDVRVWPRPRLRR